MIARAPEDVWDFVADHANDPAWCRKVKAVEPSGSRRWRVWHKPVPLRPAALLETTHTREERPTYLAIREQDDASVFDVEYRLERAARGTLFTQVSTFEWKALPRPFRTIFAIGVRRDVAGQLRALKRHLEAAQTQEPSEG